jgi:catechol 2,3-dioxygenase-like lactoylglutathione lyase family enzyme
LAGLFAGGLLLAGFFPGALEAQLEGAAQGPVAMGHHHLNVPDLDASRHFWVELLGGEAVQLGPLEVVKLPNLLVVLRRQEPSSGTFGASVNHIGLQVPDVALEVAALEAAGVAVKTHEHIPMAEGPVFDLPDQNTRVAFVESPSGVRVELFEYATQERPVENHHIHFYVAEPAAARDWYVQHFGATPRKRGSFDSADLPGVNLTFSPGETSGTEGTALDHIGFEVNGLAALVDRLKEQGIVFSRPYTEVEPLGLSFAFFTDPWGTYVELTEGLDQL